MKKIFFSIIAAVLLIPAWGVPADPTPYKYAQPDGSVIVLRNHGDEYFHWTTDELGRVVEKGADGFYRPSAQSFAAMAAQARQQRAMQRVWSSFDNPYATNSGDRKVLCIIANFTDSTFILPNPKQHFTDMLNEPGYSYNGAIGSVRDYYIDNSRGRYRPQFDVYGPVTLSQSSEYYDKNGVYRAITEAYEMLAAEIDINDYDTDDDGTIDMILFYYPGHNEAEGGGTESIWPHQSTGYFGMLGGKRFARYFCTSELRGASGTEAAAIGTTCHEFAHSLGLPDFYDTDYESNGGKNSVTTGVYDLMTSGNYNDNGRRPPYLSALERNMLGWMDYPVGISASGNYTLSAVQNNQAYQFDSQRVGEYFIVEYRNGEKWDSTLSPGLLLYHIDKSDRLVGDGRTAAQLWGGNSINAYGGHPCYYLVPQTDTPQLSSNGTPRYWNEFVFPGWGNVTSFIPKDWDGNEAGLSLTSIAHDGNTGSFTVTVSSQRTVLGTVRDTDGNPLKNVTVSLTPSTVPFAAAPPVSSGNTTLTDENGNYSLTLENTDVQYQILLARKDGYVPTSVNLTISSLFLQQDLVLLRQGEGLPGDLIKHDPVQTFYSIGLSGSSSIAAGMRYTAAELAEMDAVGALLKTVSFIAGASNGERVYVVVNIGSAMTLRKEVTAQYTPNTWVTIDVSNEGITIPAGEDIFIGYGLTDIVEGTYPFRSFGMVANNNGQCYVCRNFLNSSTINAVSFSGGNYTGFAVSATIARTKELEFAALGVSYIRLNGGTPEVVVAAGKSLRSESWYLDGAAVNTPPAVNTLSSGPHVYMVRLLYYDGSSERVYYEVDN